MKRAPLAASLAIFLATSVGSGCNGCDAGPVETLSPVFSIPEENDFGSLIVGSREVRSIVIANTGNARGSIRIEIPAEPFALLSSSVLDVAPGGEVDVLVLASPTSVGQFRADLVFALESEELRLRLFGEAIAAPDCDDDNVCTTEEFDVATRACIYRRRDGACDDANACSENDRCLVGVCVGDPIVCEDDFNCTVDGCDPLLGCTFVGNDTLCDDGNLCSDDICDSERGCQATPSPEGSRCGDGVICEFANLCLGGVCLAVQIPEGISCDDDDPCTGASYCAAGVCVADPATTVGTSHSVTTERNFLPASWVRPGSFFGDKNQAVYVGDFLYVIAKNALIVVEAWPHGFEVIRRLPELADGVVKLDDVTLATFTRDGFVRMLDLEEPADPVQVRTWNLGARPTAVFANDDGSLGFCIDSDGEVTPNNFRYHYAPRTSCCQISRELRACEDPVSLIGMGDRLVSSRFSSAGNTRTVFDASGQQLFEVVEVSSEGSGLYEVGFRVGNLAVYPERSFTGVSALTLVDDETLEAVRLTFPVEVRQVLGVIRTLLYVVTPENELVTLEVGAALTAAFPPFALPPHEDATLLAVSDDQLFIQEETYEPSNFSVSLWTLNLSANGEVVGKGRDGFSTSVAGFNVGTDQSLTVFGTGSVTRGDVASLRSAPVNPLARRSATSELAEPMLAFEEGLFVGAFVLQPNSSTGLCIQCDLGLQWYRRSLSTTEFAADGDGTRQTIPAIWGGTGQPYFQQASVFGSRLAVSSRGENSILYLDLAPVSESGFPQQINAYPVSAPTLDDGTHIDAHADDLVTIVHGQVATLVDFTTTPPVEVAADANLPGGGIALGSNYKFFSSDAAAGLWLHLMSGGASAGGLAINPVLTIVARDEDNPELNAPPVRVELPSNADALGSQAGYRARILGVDNGLLYVSHVRIAGDQHLSEVLVYVLETLATGPHETIPLSTEAVGMAVLPDGGRLIGREDGFTFVYPECRE